MKLKKARPHLYESIDDQQQNQEGDFGRRTMPTGGLYLPNCLNKMRYGKQFRTPSIRSVRVIAKCSFLETSSI